MAILTEEEKKEITQVTQLVFGQPLEAHKDLHGVDVYLRTLFDGEVRDALRRGMMAASPTEQVFEIDRWKLAYSLQSVSGTELKGTLEEKRQIIDGWLTIYVNLLIDIYETLGQEELVAIDTLKKFTGIQEPQSISN